eukprot:PhF_6_TR18691/c0_g1_i2/m.27320
MNLNHTKMGSTTHRSTLSLASLSEVHLEEAFLSVYAFECVSKIECHFQLNSITYGMYSSNNNKSLQRSDNVDDTCGGGYCFFPILVPPPFLRKGIFSCLLVDGVPVQKGLISVPSSYILNPQLVPSGCGVLLMEKPDVVNEHKSSILQQQLIALGLVVSQQKHAALVTIPSLVCPLVEILLRFRNTTSKAELENHFVGLNDGVVRVKTEGEDYHHQQRRTKMEKFLSEKLTAIVVHPATATTQPHS